MEGKITLKNIVGIRFKKLGKIYFFNPKEIKLQKGDKIIVETSQGEEYAEVLIPNRYVEDEKIVAPLKKVLRIATNKDIKRHEECKKIEIADRITQIQVKDEYVLNLENEGIIINLGDASDLKNRMYYVSAIMKQETGNKGTIYVNGNLNEGFFPYFSAN